MLFFHPFKPLFDHPSKASPRVTETIQNRENSPSDMKASRILTKSSSTNNFFRKSKKKNLKVKTKYMDTLSQLNPSGQQEGKGQRELKRQSSVNALKRYQSSDSISTNTIETLLPQNSNSPSPSNEGKIPRFMAPTASSLRHMVVTPQQEDNIHGGSSQFTEQSTKNGLQKLRKAKTIINIFAAMKNNKTATEGSLDLKKPLPATPYLAYSEQQERMNLFMNNFEMSDMTPFLESIERLYQVIQDPKAIIEKAKMCPVPRSYKTPFPMLKILNAKVMSMGDYILAENEEIYDICAHHNKSIGKKFSLNAPLLDGKKRLKFKMHFGKSLTEKELQNLNIEEHYSSSSDEQNDTELLKQEEEDPLVRKTRQKRLEENTRKDFDAEYLLNAIIKSKRGRMDKQSIGQSFGIYVDDSNQIDFKLNANKWDSIQNMLPEPISIGFSEAIRRRFLKNKKISDEFLGIKRKPRQIDFRPFKEQILDLSLEEVMTRMKRKELDQNIEQWSETVEFLKGVEVNTMGNGKNVHNERLIQKLEEKAKKESKMKGNFKNELDIYLENDEISKFFHQQHLEYLKNIKQKEKEEQNRQKKELKMTLSNKGIRRHLAKAGVEFPAHKLNSVTEEATNENIHPIRFGKIFI